MANNQFRLLWRAHNRNNGTPSGMYKHSASCGEPLIIVSVVREALGLLCRSCDRTGQNRRLTEDSDRYS